MKPVSPSTESVGAGDNLFYNGVYLYSRYAPRQRAEQIAAAFIPQPETFYLIPSPLYGYGLELIRQKCRETGTSFLIAETDLFLYKKTVDKECLYFDTENDFPSVISKIGNILRADFSANKRIRKVSVLPLNEGYRLHKEEYDRIALTVQKEIDLHWKNRSTMIFFKDLWIRNIVRNLPETSETIAVSKESYPYAVCGAGASLEDALDFLAEKRRYLRIVAADTALPVLLKKEIIPDYVVVLESQTANCSDFIYGVPDETIFINELSSAPAANRLFHRKKWIRIPFSETELFRRIPGSFPSFPQTGSVGVAALYAATRLTDGPVLVTGLDFCYIPGKTHARGTDTHERLLLRQTRFCTVEAAFRAETLTGQSVEGRAVAVSNALSNYASLVAGEAGRFSHLFDCRSDGLPIGLPRRKWIDIRLSKSPLPPLPFRIETVHDKQALSFFFTGEENLLNRAETETVTDSLSDKTLKEINCLHYFFPDYRLSNPEESYRTRLFFYIRKLKRLLKKISRHPI